MNYYKGDYDKSVEHYYNAIEMFDSINYLPPISSIYINLGSLFQEKKDLVRAKFFLEKAIRINNQLKDSSSLAAIYNNLGIVYKKQNKIDSAIVYYEASIAIKKAINEESSLASTLSNLGQLCTQKEEYDLALKYHIESLALERKFNNEVGVCQSYINIGETFLAKEDYNSATFYIQSGYEKAKNLNMLDNLIAATHALAMLYHKTNEHEKAFQYHILYSNYKDSLLNDRLNETIAEMDAKYENETNRKEIALLSKEKELQEAVIERQATFRIALIIGLILILVIMTIIMVAYRQKKKANELLASQKDSIELKNKEITDSINYAERIQQALLFTEESEFLKTHDNFILFLPKDIVSGDFYWINENQNYTYIAVSDCTGHGVPGAFMSMLGISFLNEITTNNQLISPAEVLNQLRDKVINNLSQKGESGTSKDGMDISLIRVNNSTKEIEWAGANNPLWIIRKKELIELKPDKQPIGYYINQQPFTNHELKLEKEDKVYLFSDGYVDQFGGESNKKFMKKRLKELFFQYAEMPINEHQLILLEQFKSWKGNNEQVDDICLIGFEV
ncbi:MAG: hypothetical protein CVT95_10075 [Bacteroidetes bacterium HGW-Bacteroidetes-12]|nr:MAG: hypothetical protein CVT95_10075 [Bacteroidetes bacterium HGW-Bacteroidetes-12]